MNTSENTQKDQRKDLIRLSVLSVLILILMSLLNAGCYYSCEKYSYLTYETHTMSIDSLRETVSEEPPRDIMNPSSLYHKDGYIFVSEREEGIHLIDNTDPAQPNPLLFLSIPGHFSLAIKGTSLYADSYTDLLVFDISDLENIRLVTRQDNVFQHFAAMNAWYNQADQTIVKYIPTEYEDTDCGVNSAFGGHYRAEGDVIAMDGSFNNKGGVSGSGTGQAGSMARFVVDDETLYTVDQSSLNVFDVTTPEAPVSQGIVQLGWGIETIFPYRDMLFVGANNGMHILSNADPLNPELLSSYAHVNSCDPVVVQGDYAYVTLRSGNECAGFTNQLEIVSIKDPRNPTLVKTYEMLNPHGLAVNGQCLFICEGAHGLKSFTLGSSDPTQITLQQFYENVDAFDVISLPDVLLMVGSDGFYQYDYTCGGTMHYLSYIAVGARQ